MCVVNASKAQQSAAEHNAQTLSHHSTAQQAPRCAAADGSAQHASRGVTPATLRKWQHDGDCHSRVATTYSVAVQTRDEGKVGGHRRAGIDAEGLGCVPEHGHSNTSSAE
eukprot:2558194-Pleurochrysis_carterae.AAC.5